VSVFSVPLPPDDLAMVWDKDGDRWSRVTAGNGTSGGMWREAEQVGVPGTRTWYDLVAQFGPLSTERQRCAAWIELESPCSDVEWDMLRCVHVPGHSGLHHPDLDALKWDEREHVDPATPCLQCGKHAEISHWSKFCKVDGTSRDVSHWCCPGACQLGDWCPR